MVARRSRFWLERQEILGGLARSRQLLRYAGRLFEELLEGWKQDLRNVWWVVAYPRQSLDSIITERLFARIDDLFRAMGWRVEILKYGKLLDRAFAQPGGDALNPWIAK